ncbi:MAG: lytic transglycosylase domain-containing protein [Pseudomonadota bacterium]
MKSLLTIVFFGLISTISAFSYSQVNRTIDPVVTTALLKYAYPYEKRFQSSYESAQWISSMNYRLRRFVPNGSMRISILLTVIQEARKHNLPPELILSIMEVESRFKSSVTSHAGAEGIMQIMPFWKKSIGTTSDNLFDVKTNIQYGCAILSQYLKREKGNHTRALGRYNGSLGKTWYAERVYAAFHKNWEPTNK